MSDMHNVLLNVVTESTKEKPLFQMITPEMTSSSDNSNSDLNQVSFEFDEQTFIFKCINTECQNFINQIKEIYDDPSGVSEELINNSKHILKKLLSSNPNNTNLILLRIIREAIVSRKSGNKNIKNINV